MTKYSLAALVGGAILSVASASASTTAFNFASDPTSSGNPYGNTLTYTVGTGSAAVTVTETAWYVASGYNTPANNVKFQTAVPRL